MKTLRLMRVLLQASIALMPWMLKRRLLQWIFGYELDPTARIGLSWIYPRHLQMASESRIDSFTVAIHLDRIAMEEHATIGRGNWITGFPSGSCSSHFAHQAARRPELHLEAHASITKNHHIDCTDRVRIGAFTTIAGYRSQLLTHSIDLQLCRQHSAPIQIGAYCFVGSNCVILGGSVLPDQCVLGALSLLNKPQREPLSLYAGQPARRVKAINPKAAYFSRRRGHVV